MLPASRMQASDLLQNWVDDRKLISHAMAVEGVMRYYAEKIGEPPVSVRRWGLAGMLHDLAFQEYPQEHCAKAQEIMTMAGYDEDFIRAVVSHGYLKYNDVKPETEMEKVLYASAEMTKLISAAVLAERGRTVMETELPYIMEKYGDSSFAAETVDRAVIEKAAELLGWSVEEIAEMTLAGLRTVPYEAGLMGEDDEDEDE